MDLFLYFRYQLELLAPKTTSILVDQDVIQDMQLKAFYFLYKRSRSAAVRYVFLKKTLKSCSCLWICFINIFDNISFLTSNCFRGVSVLYTSAMKNFFLYFIDSFWFRVSDFILDKVACFCNIHCTLIINNIVIDWHLYIITLINKK